MKAAIIESNSEKFQPDICCQTNFISWAKKNEKPLLGRFCDKHSNFMPKMK